jgi:hypothetical protein
MEEIINRVFIEPFSKFYEEILQYMPNILGFVLIILTGFALGLVLKLITLKFLRLIRMDSLSERIGIPRMLGKWGIRESVSSIFSRMAFWLVTIVFFIIALSVLEVPQIEHILRSFFLYLPNVFAAGLILLVGYFLSDFAGRAALIAAVNADIGMSGIIGKLVKAGILILSLTMALEQLGIGRGTIVVAFAIVFGGMVFSISLALGLGGRHIARRFLEKRLHLEGAEEEDPRDRDDEITHV